MERESVPATERYVKPVSGYALHSHVTAAGCCWNERTEWCPRALSSLSLLFSSSSDDLQQRQAQPFTTPRFHAERYRSRVAFALIANDDRQKDLSCVTLFSRYTFIRTRKEQFCCCI